MRPLHYLFRGDESLSPYRLTVVALSIYGAAAVVVIALVTWL